MKKIVIVLICFMLACMATFVVSSISVKKDLDVEPLDAGFFCRLSFDGKTGACLIRHFEFSRPVESGIKWGFMQFSDAEISFGRHSYSGDGIMYLSHFLGKTSYNEDTEHWTFDGFARCCLVKEL